jgi:hypothetical protein
MYEPHRCQHVLLRSAYAQVLPELKRLIWDRLPMAEQQGELVVYAEKERAR